MDGMPQITRPKGGPERDVPKMARASWPKFSPGGGTPTKFGAGSEMVCIDVVRGVAWCFSCAAAVGAGIAARGVSRR